ncbi:dihydroorotate dehydrogenase (quinone) mitochondrial [Phtheirospermum japonicum]|uniref:Dihydroorotate dehydrogenase (quinone), mitochondrial n=1 Tax=Phtheirospermum japonicum TaxID=374723 RepID=A0A830D7V3_9LAMI|nr:dihydroorotate dehydrogenase (quinone) mitochondrial [Phtheirospermum japonicum]
MATRLALKFMKQCCTYRKVKLNDNFRHNFCTAASAGTAHTPPPPIPKKVPHFSKKGRLFTGAAIGLLIGGGAYASTVDEATFCGWLFNATKLVNPFFAFLDPEVAHRLAVSAAARGWVPIEKRPDPPILELEVWGRRFSNPIGLSAGFDKNAEAVEGLLGLGFGFVEVGSVTPVPQEGNPKPRIFRLRNEGAIINRCGFNSEGIVAVAKRLGAQHGKRKLETTSSSSLIEEEVVHGGKAGPGILGVNLGKNKTSEDAAADYVQGVHTLSQYADYLVINISSPNTPGLRQLQGRKQLKDLVKKVQAARDEMQWGEEGPPPLLVKIAPDLSKQDLEDIAADVVQVRTKSWRENSASPKALLYYVLCIATFFSIVALALRVDGLIISNTTIQRPDSVSQNPVSEETGGLSGQPLFNLSTNILKDMYILTKGRIPLIGCGGISSGEDAYKKIRAGATLVQLYTAFAYGGPALIPKIKGRIPLIGCGAERTRTKKIRAGATLVQLYTAFAYGGPALIPKIKGRIPLIGCGGISSGEDAYKENTSRSNSCPAVYCICIWGTRPYT